MAVLQGHQIYIFVYLCQSQDPDREEVRPLKTRNEDGAPMLPPWQLFIATWRVLYN